MKKSTKTLGECTHTGSFNRGITLVALIVTIIILLILAGISIASLIGNGLFEKAKLAKEKQENAQIKENVILSDYEQGITNKESHITGIRDNIKVSQKLEKLLNLIDIELDLEDILTTSFFSKVTSIQSKRIILENEEIMDLILNKENYIDLIESLQISLIPILTEQGNCIESTRYGDGYSCYKAFDNLDDTYWCSRSGDTEGAYIGYKFDNPVKVYKVLFWNGSIQYGSNERCKEIKLQCSNDNITWTDASDLLTVPDSSDVFVVKNTEINDNHTYWRIYINSSYGSYVSTRSVKFLRNITDILNNVFETKILNIQNCYKILVSFFVKYHN